MNKDTKQAIVLLIICLLLCFADSFSQDNKKKFWQYSDSFFAARKRNDTAMMSMYRKKMNDYHKFDARDSNLMLNKPIKK